VKIENVLRALKAAATTKSELERLEQRRHASWRNRPNDRPC
jgi:hypothetical protein